MEEQLAPFSIYAESTPNPATMKLVANRLLVKGEKTHEFGLMSDHSASPIAARFLQFPLYQQCFHYQKLHYPH